ncbi:MAG: alanine--tRNA ligase [Xanthomonadales bacterium]|nr:alanine--tRNA ligase [Xanthomonadales bacterium]
MNAVKTTNEIRQTFLDFFARQDHTVVPSSSLVPAEDPTLLFTNAGMNQFKDVFLGAEKRAYTRAASSQKCVRAGGKHNDLDQVGYTARHHTFFEMLGNFSFGDYFKADAIRYAWELLTQVYGLPADRLWVTVYETDDEAFEIWRDAVGVPEGRILRIGDKPGGQPYESDNFWAMGDTGPCGPCSEIFYDHGDHIDGGLPGTENEDGDRYVEIWNLVFMQFDRSADGDLNPLPAPCVDTGMGLERIAAVLQDTHDNYETDQFKALVNAAAELTGAADRNSKSLRVIADHIRACAFLIADGVLPANEGRGYVLRRIIRRAVRHGFMLGQARPFFHRMVEALAAVMGEAYPVLLKDGERIAGVLEEEEQRFARTLDTGMAILDKVTDRLERGADIPGETAFLLYDTYGFPLDLTEDIARERHLGVDRQGFDTAMAAQKERARAAGQFKGAAQISAEAAATLPPTEFLGYEAETAEATVAGILVDGQTVDELEAGEEAVLVLDRTPFYAESGGQVGDTGVFTADGVRFAVADTQKLAGRFHGHAGRLEAGSLKPGDRVTAKIDGERRRSIVLHHSATHLLHKALQDLLGDHVEQRGSLVAPDHLRFDFSHPRQVTTEELRALERRVNGDIRRNPAATAEVMPFDQALETGAMALFGEKYGDEVRVLSFGDLSVELCGGTHVDRVGDIGQFKILSETAVGAGIRRIIAVAGDEAVEAVQAQESRLQAVAGALKVGPEDVEHRLGQILERQRELEKELEALKSSLAASGSDQLLDRVVEIGGMKVLSARLEGTDSKNLRDAVDHLKDKLGSGVVVLGAADDGKVRLAAGVTPDLTARIKAGDLVNSVAQLVGGRGGGRPDFAQAGGSNPEALDEALASVEAWVQQKQ